MKTLEWVFLIFEIDQYFRTFYYITLKVSEIVKLHNFDRIMTSYLSLLAHGTIFFIEQKSTIHKITLKIENVLIWRK